MQILNAKQFNEINLPRQINFMTLFDKQYKPQIFAKYPSNHATFMADEASLIDAHELIIKINFGAYPSDIRDAHWRKRCAVNNFTMKMRFTKENQRFKMNHTHIYETTKDGQQLTDLKPLRQRISKQAMEQVVNNAMLDF